MNACTVCGHEKLHYINQDLAGRESLRIIAQRYELSRDAVRRHRMNHLPPHLVKAQEVLDIVEGGTVLEHMRELSQKTQDVLRAAEEAKDYDLMLKAVKEARANEELSARLLGQLNPSKGTEHKHLHVKMQLSDAETRFLLLHRRRPTAEEAKLLAPVEGEAAPLVPEKVQS